MSKELIELALILIAGIMSQWVAWVWHIPSILLLLLTGLALGPVFGVVNPDALFGNLLFPIVSLSVGLILYEGGLSLRFREIKESSGVVFNLISIGLIATWLIAFLGAKEILGIDPSIALLLGALLTVSGPTVVLPLLRHVRATPSVSAVLKWEGILIDPVGAVVAVLILEAILEQKVHEAHSLVFIGVFKTLLVGGVLGLFGAAVMVFLLRKFLIPDYLRNPISLMVFLIVYVASNSLRHEAGLLAATVMGVAMANWPKISVSDILEFKENLRSLLISSLFVILSARLTVEDLSRANWQMILFLMVLIFIARPIGVLISTFNSRLDYRQRAFCGWIAPRGIVAAAVASLFALELEKAGIAGGEVLVSTTFFVIIGTVAVYGLTAVPVANLLGVRYRESEGTLIAGGHLFGRKIAHALEDQGFQTVIVDTNVSNVLKARDEGLKAVNGSLLSEHLVEDLDLGGVGRVLALTPNDEANSMTSLAMVEHVGTKGVFQLPLHEESKQTEDLSPHLYGRFVFGKGLTYERLEDLFSREGAMVKTTQITEKFSWGKFKEQNGDRALPLFVIDRDRHLSVFSADSDVVPGPGSRVVFLLQGS